MALSPQEAAKASLLLIRDKHNNPVKLVDGKVPEGSFLCVEGMMGGTLHGNLPLEATPSSKNLRNEAWSLQSLSHERFAWFRKGPEDGTWWSTDLTNESNWKENNHHQLLDFVLCWLNHPDQMIIEAIEDPEERQAAKTARQKEIDKKRFGM
jgi:hypothetical protein